MIQHRLQTAFHVGPSHWVVARPGRHGMWDVIELSELTMRTHDTFDTRGNAESYAQALALGEELWRPVPSMPGYEASTLGRVRSIPRTVMARNGISRRLPGKVLAAAPRRQGYPAVTGGDRRERAVHPLVLETFIGPRPMGMDGCHNNGNRLDNRLLNLRWGTRSSNLRDCFRHGTNFRSNTTHCPRNHPLSGPNVAPWKGRRGRRACLACNRAINRRRYMRTKGVELDVQLLSDAYYREILAATRIHTLTAEDTR